MAVSLLCVSEVGREKMPVLPKSEAQLYLHTLYMYMYMYMYKCSATKEAQECWKKRHAHVLRQSLLYCRAYHTCTCACMTFVVYMYVYMYVPVYKAQFTSSCSGRHVQVCLQPLRRSYLLLEAIVCKTVPLATLRRLCSSLSCVCSPSSCSWDW